MEGMEAGGRKGGWGGWLWLVGWEDDKKRRAEERLLFAAWPVSEDRRKGL